MGAQILGVKNTEVDNDALITLVDMLGERPGFDEIITLALTLHRETIHKNLEDFYDTI